jgi:hypothetical protein
VLPVSGHGPRKVQLSWGSAVNGRVSQIWAAQVTTG